MEGAESAKKQIAQNIEKKDEKSGHSLVSGMKALSQAVGAMSEKMPQLTEGIDQLYNGSGALASKNDELNSGASKLADRIQAVFDAGKSYESFGGKANDTVGNVKFIIRTGEIKADNQ